MQLHQSGIATHLSIATHLFIQSGIATHLSIQLRQLNLRRGGRVGGWDLKLPVKFVFYQVVDVPECGIYHQMEGNKCVTACQLSKCVTAGQVPVSKQTVYLSPAFP